MSSSGENKDHVLVLLPTIGTADVLLAEWRERPGVAIVECATPQELKAVLMQTGPCMVVASIESNNSIAAIATLLKLIQDEIKYGLIKTLILSKVRNNKISQFVTSQGVTDYIEEPVSGRTVSFKASLQLKAIDTIKKREAQKKGAKEKMMIKNDPKEKGSAVTLGAAQGMKPALDLGEDCFLFRNTSAKKRGKKTLFELGGPSPSAGSWQPLKESEDGQNRWLWVPTEEKKNAPTKSQNPENGWVHSGDKPEFDPDSGRWRMLSEKPNLSLYRQGKKAGSKIAQDDKGQLELAEDSPQAEAKVRETNAQLFAQEEEKNEHKKQKTKPVQDEPSGEKKAAEPAEPVAEAKGPVAINTAAELSEYNNKFDLQAHLKATEAKSTDKVVAKPDVIANTEPTAKKNTPQEATENANAASTVTPPKAENEKPRNKKHKNRKNKKPTDSIDSIQNLAAGLGKFKKKTAATEVKAKKDDGAAKLAAPSSVEEKSHKEKVDNVAALEAVATKSKTTPEAAAVASEPVKAKVTEPQAATAALKEKPAENAPAANTAKAAKEPNKSQEIRDNQKKLLQQIREELAAPIKNTLTPVERAEIAAELGLAPEALPSDAELSKKRRLERVKNLKKQVDASQISLDKIIEEDLSRNDLARAKSQAEDNTWSRQNLENADSKRKMRAFDGNLSEAEAEAANKKRVGDNTTNAAAGTNKELAYFYRTDSELGIKDGVWDSAGDWRVLLSVDIRFHGFKSKEAIMPLWIYRGDAPPEYLPDTKRWRFLGKNAEKISLWDLLPADVRDHLLNLKSRLETKDRKPTDDVAAAAPPKTEKNKEESSTTTPAAKRNKDQEDPSSSAGIENTKKDNAQAESVAIQGKNTVNQKNSEEIAAAATSNIAKEIKPEELLEPTTKEKSKNEPSTLSEENVAYLNPAPVQPASRIPKAIKLAIAVLCSDAIYDSKRVRALPAKLASQIQRMVKDVHVSFLFSLGSTSYRIIACSAQSRHKVDDIVDVNAHSPVAPPYLIAGDQQVSIWLEKTGPRTGFSNEDQATLADIVQLLQSHLPLIAKQYKTESDSGAPKAA